MFQEHISAGSLMVELVDSMTKLLDDLKTKHQELKEQKETDRTKAFHTQKLIQKWFMQNGGLRI